jgi:HEPN domain-containing protein
MVDMEQQVVWWRDGAAEDFAVAEELLASGRSRHGLFFLHLALEKAIKAHVCRHTRDLAPRIHNLVRLAELSGLDPGQKRIDVLAETNAFNIEGRYPVLLPAPPTPVDARAYFARAREVFQWLIAQL